MKSLSPENLLLILLARGELSQNPLYQAKRLLELGIDWQILLKQARLLGVESFLRRHLLQGQLSPYLSPKAQITQDLQNTARNQALANLKRYEQFEMLLSLGKTLGIDIVPLKGIFLAEWVYGDLSLRKMNDLDLLCARKDCDKLSEELKKLGYREFSQQGSANRKALIRRTGHLPILVSPAELKLELHFDLFPGQECGESTTQRLLCNSTAAQFRGLGLRLLSPEALVAHLAIHLNRHLDHINHPLALYWFADLHEVISEHKIDWNSLLSYPHELLERILPILNFLQEHWDSPVCTALPRRLEPEAENAIIEKLFSPPENQSAWRKFYFKLLKDSFSSRKSLDTLFELLFPKRDYLIERYGLNGPFSPHLYRLLHPFLILARFIRRCS